MADSPGRGISHVQRWRNPPLGSTPASRQQNARPLAQGESGSRPSSFVYGGTDDLFMPPSDDLGLRTMESCFSLNEQFAASRRDYEFDDDDAESTHELPPIPGPSDDHGNATAQNFQEDEEDRISESERNVHRLLRANIQPVDYYALLGLNSQEEPPPTVAQIRAAYHRLSLAFHPDKHPQSFKAAAERHFTRLQKAFETLVEPQKRIIYDLEGEAGVQNEYREGGCMGEGGEAERQIGVKTMEANEFGKWYMNILKERERRSIEELVGSTGTCKVVLNARRLFDHSPIMSIWETGDGKSLEIPTSPLFPEALQLRQSFSVPLPGLSDKLEVRNSLGGESFDESSRDVTANQDNFPGRAVPSGLSTTRLTFTGSVGGDFEESVIAVVPGLKVRDVALPTFSSWDKLSSDNFQISTRLQGTFPATKDRGHKIVASKLQGTDFDVNAGLIPFRTLNVGLGRSFVLIKDTRPFYCYVQTNISHCLRLKPPTVDVRVARSFGTNHLGYIHSSSGDFPWPKLKGQLLPVSGAPPWLPRGRLLPIMKIGYIWSNDGSHRSVTTDEENDMRDLDATDDKETKDDLDVDIILPSQETWHFSAYSSPLDTTLSATYGCDLFVRTPQQPVLSRTRNNGEAVNASKRTLLPPVVGIRLEIETEMALQTSFGGVVRGSRRIGDFSSIGVGLGLNHQRGLYISFSWSRLGQNVILPIILVPRDEINIPVWLMVVAIPWAAYIVAEFAIIQPRAAEKRSKLLEKKRQHLKANAIERKFEAEQAVQLMQSFVAHRQALEREQQGLVILDAKYGVRDTRHGSSDIWFLREVADVTTALAAFVDAGQLFLPRGTRKSHIIGFYDPSPMKRKILVVEYLYAGKKHLLECVGSEGLSLPQKSHEI